MMVCIGQFRFLARLANLITSEKFFAIVESAHATETSGNFF